MMEKIAVLKYVLTVAAIMEFVNWVFAYAMKDILD
jgi:hypothetical protein